MNVIGKFEQCFKNYVKLDSRGITKNEQNLFIISSFDNFIKKIKTSNDTSFSYYTIQETFRTKTEHYQLWGVDSFLMPYNIMLSIFSNQGNLGEVFEEFLFFIFSIAEGDDYVCVCSNDVNQSLYKPIINNIQDIIYVPKESLKWTAPIEDEYLFGEYIKIYKRCENGFIPVLDANIFKYNKQDVVDISSNFFTLDCIHNNLKHVYESKLFKNIDVIFYEKYKKEFLPDFYKFICVLLSITVLLINGVKPSSKKRGSVLRLLLNMFFELSFIENFNIMQNKELIEKLIATFVINLKNYLGINTSYSLEDLVRIFNFEIDRINNKHNIEYIIKMVRKINDFSTNNLSFKLLEYKENFGLIPKVVLKVMVDYGIIDKTIYNIVLNKFIYNSNVSVIPINKNDSINDEFLQNIFLMQRSK